MSSDTCNLTVIGTSDRINALTNDDIKVYVDVVGLKKGRHNVKLEVELSDETLTYRLDSDEQIRVNIKKRRNLKWENISEQMAFVGKLIKI